MSDTKPWTDEQIKESAENYETLLLGHATFAPREWFEGAMTEVRDDMQATIDELTQRIDDLMAYYIGVVESKDAQLATAQQEFAELRGDDWGKVADYLISLAPEPEPPLPEPPDNWDEDGEDNPHYDTPGGW